MKNAHYPASPPEQDNLLIRLNSHKVLLQEIQSRLGTHHEQPHDFERANDLAHEVINIQLIRNFCRK